jgi:hypothetical protein
MSTPNPQPSASACINGAQKDFLCIGSISGTQTYYACVNGTWISKSRLNNSECQKTFGPNESIEDVMATPTANASASPAENATIIPSAMPSPTLAANASVPTFISLTINEIRTSSADLYWRTNLNTTGTVKYGEEPGVRRWTYAEQFPAVSQYQHLLSLSPNKTYYFEVEVCANSICATTPTLSFSTPSKDEYSLPASQFTYTASQLNVR